VSLDRRLTLLFVLIGIPPLVIAGFIFQRVVEDEVERRAVLSLQPTLGVARDAHEERIDGLQLQVAGVASSPEVRERLQRGRARRLDGLLMREARAGGLDFLIAITSRGRLLTAAVRPPGFVRGHDVPRALDILAAPFSVQDGFARSSRVAVKGSPVRLVGGFWIDDEVLIASTPTLVELAVSVDGTLVSSSRSLDRALPLGETPAGRFELDVAGGGPAAAEPLGRDTALVAWAPYTPLRDLVGRIVGPLALLLLAALLSIGVLASILSRWITRPIAQLSERAKAMSQGHFEERIEVRAKGEVRELATALNELSERISRMIDQLSSSRAQLQRAVRRVGETLRSTHNMEQILESLMNTAADAVEADAAVVWRFSPNRRELHAALTRGVEGAIESVPVGTGAAGIVAEHGAPITRVLEASSSTAAIEPDLPVAAAAPIHNRGHIQAVIVVYRADAERPFAQEDLDTITFLAEQGGVAIENVTLHEEAQRLSLTDGLTGVWNRRYFQMSFRQTLATAVRFERPFSVLMMDLDHFKRVNDTYGHQRGDAVLVEFARRVNDVLREIDTFARYGGEEFVALLSETDFSGAITTAGKIIDVVGAEPFGEGGEEPVRLTVSVGISSYPRHGASYSALIEAADQALYEAKQTGRDRVVVAGGQPPNLTVAR
jgi:two-component system cell cycle response regulator